MNELTIFVLAAGDFGDYENSHYCKWGFAEDNKRYGNERSVHDKDNLLWKTTKKRHA